MSRNAERVVFANCKGGTGKTISCLSIAGWLAKNGHSVLVVDFDPQASATSGLGIDRLTLNHTMYDVVLRQLEGYQGVPVTQIILETDVRNLHLAPSEMDLAVAEVLMQRHPKRSRILDKIIEEVRGFYDFILIDSPPSTGLLMINGLCASDQVVVPVEPSIFSLETLENLIAMFRDIRRMDRHFINEITAVLNRYEKSGLLTRTLGCRTPSTEVRAGLERLFHAVFIVPESKKVYRAQKEGVPISHIAPRSGAGKAFKKIAERLVVTTQQKNKQG